MQARTQHRLEGLLRALNDPLLSDRVAAYRAGRTLDKPVSIGFDDLLRLAPEGARLSYIAEARTITALLLAYEREGRKRNTARRQMHRAISLLLTHEYGKHERGRIFADVDFPSEDDAREVYVSPEEIARLLEACRAQAPELETIVRLALLTSADRGVILAGQSPTGWKRGLLTRDVSIFQEADESYSGEVYLYDTKAKDRTRTVPFGDRLARELLVLVRGKAPDDPVFSLRYPDLDYPWKRARQAAGLPHITFKDLRAQFSIYAEKAGVPLTVVSKSMGHSGAKGEAMTRRYQRHAAVMAAEQARALEAAMLAKAG